MSKTLKPISDFERGLLAALGETAEQHQKQVQERMFSTPLQGTNDTRKALSELNRLFERKRNSSRYEAVADVARRIQEKELSVDEKPRVPLNIDEALEKGWKMEAHVLFIHEFHCACGHVCTGLDISKPALRLASPRDPKTKVYYPVSSLSLPGLPRIRDTKIESIPHCHKCFEENSNGPS